MKSSSLGVHNDDDGRKITIDDKHHLIGQWNFSNSNYISFPPCCFIWQFFVVCILCKTNSRTIYYVFRLMSVWLVITRG